MKYPKSGTIKASFFSESLEGQRREPATGDVCIATGRIGGLLFAEPSGSLMVIFSRKMLEKQSSKRAQTPSRRG
jgi:hypothetical protein